MRRNKMRTFFMILGIVISIAALVLTISLGKGFQKQISDRAKKYLGSNNMVIMAQKMKMNGKPFDTGLISTLTMDDLKAVASEVPSVNAYDPVQYAYDREVVAGNHSISTIIKGGSVQGEFVWNRGVSKGQYFNEGEELNASRIALIGPKIAQFLFGDADPIGESIRIGGTPFTVKGVLIPKGVDPHGNDLDLDIVIPITTLMKRMLNVDYLLMGKIALRENADMDEAVRSITAVLNERHHITDGSNSDFTILTPAFVKEKISEMTRVFNVFLPLISLIALLAAGIVIVVLMFISVNERMAEIGLRKAVGARSKDLMYQFITEVSATSLVGGIMGMVTGLALFAMISTMMQIPFRLSFIVFAGAILLPVAVGIMAGIIPARKAARYNPVDALR